MLLLLRSVYVPAIRRVTAFKIAAPWRPHRPDVLLLFTALFCSARTFLRLRLRFHLEALTDIVRHSFHRNFQRGGQFAM